MINLGPQLNRNPQPTLHERLSAALPPEVMERLDQVRWRWPASHLLDTKGANPPADLVVWFPPPGKVIFGSPTAKAALLRGEVCRIAAAIFPDRYQLIAIGRSTERELSHRQLIESAGASVQRTLQDARQIGGAMLTLQGDTLELAPSPAPATLNRSIPEAHTPAILAAVRRAITKAP